MSFIEVLGKSLALSGTSVLDARDIDLDAMDKRLLDERGRLRALPAEELRATFPRDWLRAWAQARGRYQFPTAELIEWLRETIGDKSVIEIGAGMGDLGAHLGIKMTDSGVQQRADMRAHYAFLNCAITKPPPDVVRLDALAAARKFKPHTIVSAWVTQKFKDGDTESRIGSCIAGVDEAHLLNLCKRLIFIGNTDRHGDKRILSVKHTEMFPPWLVSRASNQDANVIWIWER